MRASSLCVRTLQTLRRGRVLGAAAAATAVARPRGSSRCTYATAGAMAAASDKARVQLQAHARLGAQLRASSELQEGHGGVPVGAVLVLPRHAQVSRARAWLGLHEPSPSTCPAPPCSRSTRARVACRTPPLPPPVPAPAPAPALHARAHTHTHTPTHTHTAPTLGPLVIRLIL